LRNVLFLAGATPTIFARLSLLFCNRPVKARLVGHRLCWESKGGVFLITAFDPLLTHIRYSMPPEGGFAIGLGRLLMQCTHVLNIG
jgi:hypothetical protein